MWVWYIQSRQLAKNGIISPRGYPAKKHSLTISGTYHTFPQGYQQVFIQVIHS